MLAGAIDAFERLLVEQYPEAMFAGNVAHECHDEHVVVDGKVALLVNGCQLKLVGGNLVVACLAGNAQFPGFDFEFLHEGRHPGRYGAEIMVFQLLVLGRLVSHQGPSGQQQIGACRIQSFIHEEIFLFPAEVGMDTFHFRVEVMADIGCCLVDGTKSLQQGSFIVKGFAGIGDEDGRDAESVFDDESGGGGVPCGIAPRLECVADTSVRE